MASIRSRIGEKMKDRYLSKAKRIDNGEWVVGYIARYGHTGKEKYYIIPSYASDLYAIEVDSPTICQCTGLKDKNGKLIWENDICIRILLPTKRIKTNFKIDYVPYKCCLSAIDLDGENVTFLSDYINNQYEVEVIGNIFDNKELLESEK